jgi:hypothetical protein
MIGTIGNLKTERYKERCSKSKIPFMERGRECDTHKRRRYLVSNNGVVGVVEEVGAKSAMQLFSVL